MQIFESLRGYEDAFGQWGEIVSALHGSSSKGKEAGDTTIAEPSGCQEAVVVAVATGNLKFPNAMFAKLWEMRLSEASAEQDWETWAGLVAFNESVWPSILAKFDKDGARAKAAIVDVVIDHLRKPNSLDEFRAVMTALHAVQAQLQTGPFLEDLLDLYRIAFVHEVSESEVDAAVATRDRLCDLRAETPSNWAKATSMLVYA